MSSNLTLNCNVYTNPIVAGNLVGTYNGLFSEASGVAERSAGFMSVAVKSNGVFTGSVKVNGTSGGFGGTLDVNGDATVTLVTNETALNLSLHLDYTGGSKQITGTVSNTVDAWSAAVTNDLAVYAAATYPTPGHYTAAIAAANVTPGDGALALNVNATNVVVSPGSRLADSMALGGSFAISKDGKIALYENLYNSKGLLHGYLTITSTNVTGSPVWLRPDNSSSGVILTTYSAGFTTNTTVNGGPYAGSASVFDTGTRTLSFAGVDGATDISYTVHITALTNITKVVSTVPTNALTASIEKSTGLVTYSYRPTGAAANIKGKGIYQQAGTNVVGGIIGTSVVGSATLSAP